MDQVGFSGTIISIPFNEHKIDALYYHLDRDKEHVDNKPVILRLHGLLGNLLDDTEHDLPQILAQHRYSSITMNTLLANLGLFFGFGVFDDVMPQIDAACDFLRKIGFKKIVIAGHGLGGCMAIRYGALRNDPTQHADIQGVIAISTAYSLPDTIRKRWEKFGSRPSYMEVYEKAKHIFRPNPGEDPLDDETIVVTHAHGPSAKPEHTEIYTLKTWWALAGPEAEGPKPYLHVGQITAPILLVHGAHDEMIDAQECDGLEKIAKDSGNQDVSVLALDAGHNMEGKHEELGLGIVKWMQARFE